MPKTRLQTFTDELSKPTIPEPRFLAELFRRYAKAYGLTLDDVAAALGCSQPNVSAMLARPSENWRLKEIQQFCNVLHVPVSDALRAAMLRL